MFFTSFTTMMAFLVGGASPILPLSSFGIFTGILVAVNYISVIVFFPNVVLMHHLYFEKSCCYCACCGCASKSENSISTNVHRPKKNAIVRFFGGPYFRFVTHKVVRWIILLVFAGFLAYFIWSAVRIEPSSDEVIRFCCVLYFIILKIHK